MTVREWSERMDIEWALRNFGYAAVCIGTFFEGEVILLVAGFAAHRGYLNLYLVMTAAFLGSFAGDQLYFGIGRRHGRAFLSRRSGWADRVEKFNSLMHRYGIAVIILFRFFYGLRTVAPFAIGLSGISFGRFFILNFISAVIWAVSFGFLGYVCGHGVELVIEDVKQYELALLAIGVALAAVVMLLRRIRVKKRDGKKIL